jgi:hypothetical protein
MGTATKPFIHRRGLLPFCSSEAASIADTNYDYVNLTASGSDEGLSHAVELYWLLENITFNPAGTIEEVATGNTAAFSESFSSLNPSPTNLSNYQVSGAIAGNVAYVSAQPPVEPIFRQCSSDRLLARASLEYTVTSPSVTQSCFSQFYIAYDSVAGWRLYYRITAGLTGAGSGFAIRNPAQFPATIPYASGTFSLFGLTLQWRAYFSSPFLTHTLTGPGITASSAAWSF